MIAQSVEFETIRSTDLIIWACGVREISHEMIAKLERDMEVKHELERAYSSGIHRIQIKVKIRIFLCKTTAVAPRV